MMFHAIHHRRISRATSFGFTLMEVILALVVLGGSAAILGEILRISNRHSIDARAETQAQILARSIVDEIVAGYIEANDARDEVIETNDGVRWVYSITAGRSVIEGVIPLEVTVRQDIEERLGPVSYRLICWLPSVEELPEEDEAAEEAQEDAEGEGSSTSASGGGA
jgi:prepilin-type N-terminal cleavage/methylation domain-containing protein